MPHDVFKRDVVFLHQHLCEYNKVVHDLRREIPICGRCGTRRRKPKTLSEMEKLMGKAEFAEKIGGYVTKPLGKPTLALSTDKREAYNPAAADFAGVAANE